MKIMYSRPELSLAETPDAPISAAMVAVLKRMQKLEHPTVPAEKLDDLAPRELLSEYEAVTENSLRIAIGELGAGCGWDCEQEGRWDYRFVELLPESTDAEGFAASHLYTACREYRRECRLDLSPGRLVADALPAGHALPRNRPRRSLPPPAALLRDGDRLPDRLRPRRGRRAGRDRPPLDGALLAPARRRLAAGRGGAAALRDHGRRTPADRVGSSGDREDGSTSAREGDDMTETPDELEVEDAPVDEPDEELPYHLALLEELVTQTARAAGAAERIAEALERLAVPRLPLPPPRVHIPPPTRRDG